MPLCFHRAGTPWEREDLLIECTSAGERPAARLLTKELQVIGERTIRGGESIHLDVDRSGGVVDRHAGDVVALGRASNLRIDLEERMQFNKAPEENLRGV